MTPIATLNLKQFNNLSDEKLIGYLQPHVACRFSDWNPLVHDIDCQDARLAANLEVSLEAVKHFAKKLSLAYEVNPKNVSRRVLCVLAAATLQEKAKQPHYADFSANSEWTIAA